VKWRFAPAVGLGAQRQFQNRDVPQKPRDNSILVFSGLGGEIFLQPHQTQEACGEP
jgi:hypothetical protein